MIRISLVACWLLVALAETARAQDPQPRDILLEARSHLPQIFEKTDKWGTTRHIAEWLARAGSYDDAIATTLQDSLFVEQAFRELARIRAQNGDLPGAIAMIGARQHGADSAHSISSIAADRAESGRLDEAFALVSGLKGRAMHDVQLAAASWLVKSGRLVAAESTITLAEREGAFVDQERSDLAVAFFKAGKTNDAKRIAHLVRDADNAPDFEAARVDVAVQKHAWKNALALIATRAPDVSAPALERLAREMAQAGDTVPASQVLRDAESTATRIANRVDQLRILASIAATQRALGLRETAALRMKIPDVKRRPAKGSEGCDMVWAFGEAGRISDALAVDREVHCGLRAVATYQLVAGDVAGALRTMQQVTNSADITATVAEWASRQAKAHDLPTALKVFGTLRVEHAYDDGYLSPAANEIAHEMSRRGEIQSALAWARGLSTADQRAAALTGVARAVIEQRSPDAARPLFPR